MAYSYKILSIFGIDIELHISFLLFILLLLLLSPSLGLLILLIFIYVTLHELSHSYVALRNGVVVRKIVLLPIGGMAMIDTPDVSPYSELKIALAGPVFNFVMVYAILGLAFVFHWHVVEWLDLFMKGNISQIGAVNMFIFYSLYANLILGAFNLLLPAFPLDGGRVFRALLAYRMNYEKATLVARNTSIGVASLLLGYAIVIGDLWVMIIAGFIIFAALGEYQSLLLSKSLARMKIQDVIIKKPLLVKESESTRVALSKMKKSRRSFILTDKNNVVSLRSIVGMNKKDLNTFPISNIALRVIPCSMSHSVEKILKSMSAQDTGLLPIIDKGKIVGVVYKEDINRLLQVQELLNNEN